MHHVNNVVIMQTEQLGCIEALEEELQSSRHWGRGGLETNENILSTLQALVESTCHLPADNRLGTFQMFL